MIRLFMTTRGGLTQAVVVLIIVAALSLAPVDLSVVPFRDAAASLLLAGSVAAGAIVAPALGSPWRDLEESLPHRPLIFLRTGWYLTLTAAMTLVAVSAFVLRGLESPVVIGSGRNMLLAIGIGAISACLLPRAVAWAPAVSFAMMSWIWGTKDLAGTPRWWALANHDIHSPPALITALFAWILGGALYTARDGRQIPQSNPPNRRR